MLFSDQGDFPVEPTENSLDDRSHSDELSLNRYQLKSLPSTVQITRNASHTQQRKGITHNAGVFNYRWPEENMTTRHNSEVVACYEYCLVTNLYPKHCSSYFLQQACQKQCARVPLPSGAK